MNGINRLRLLTKEQQGHDPDLHVYDIVLGKYATNIGAFRTPKQPLGGGSNSLTWVEAFDVLPTKESDPEPIAIRKFEGDQELLMAAHKVRYDKGEVVEGTIGSADVWNNELDRIQFFHERYATSVEEMEAASVAQIASQLNVPFLEFEFYLIILPITGLMTLVQEKLAKTTCLT